MSCFTIFDLCGVSTDIAHSHYLTWKRLADAKGMLRAAASYDKLAPGVGDPAVLTQEDRAIRGPGQFCLEEYQA